MSGRESSSSKMDSSAPKEGMGLLWYAREKLGNCVIRVVYKTANDHSNSGVYIRIADRPADPWFAVHHGFEVQIMDQGERGPEHRLDLHFRQGGRRAVQVRRMEHPGNHHAGQHHHHHDQRHERSPSSTPAA